MNNRDHRDLIVPLLGDLRAYSRFLVPQQSDADALVEETLTRALGGLEQLGEPAGLRAGLFTILRTVFHERGHGRRNLRPRQAARIAVRNSKAAAELHQYLFTLPASLREALVLVTAQGMTVEETARICAVSVDTVRARVSRAHAQLAGRVRRDVAVGVSPAGVVPCALAPDVAGGCGIS